MADERIIAIIKRELERNPDDNDSVVRRSYAAIKRAGWFGEVVDDVMGAGVRGILNDMRHNINTAIKKEHGKYGGPAKVVPGEATARVALLCLGYMIAGKTLGNVLGEELEGIAQDESAVAKGHQFNVKLCRKLKPLVADGKTVGQCLSEAKLKGIFKDLS